MKFKAPRQVYSFLVSAALSGTFLPTPIIVGPLPVSSPLQVHCWYNYPSKLNLHSIVKKLTSLTSNLSKSNSIRLIIRDSYNFKTCHYNKFATQAYYYYYYYYYYYCYHHYHYYYQSFISF